MNYVIHRYFSVATEEIVHQMPEGAILAAEFGDQAINFFTKGVNLWVLAPVGAPKIERKFRLYATGEEIKDFKKLRHISTFREEKFVYHLFEEVA